MNRVYQEKIFSGLLAILPGAVGVALLSVFAYTWSQGTFKHASTAWFFLGTGLFLLLVAINFSFLIIKISPDGDSTRFGILSHYEPLDNIAGFYQDINSNLSYGGFGIRLAWVNGKRRWVYNVFQAPRVVIQQKCGSNREFVFSTRNPDEVMKYLKEVSVTQC